MLVLRKYSTGSGSACIGYTCVCVWSLELLGKQACLLCSEKRGEEKTDRELRGEKMQGNQDRVSCTGNSTKEL
jgi:hypothetical protein